MSAASKKEEKVPSITVKARGRINSVLDQLGALYRGRNPDRDCRWVYAPTHKPELSNVLGRRASGYVEVRLVDLPEAKDLMQGLNPDDVVRVGDLVLMSIEAELREIYKKEAHDTAAEQGSRVGRKYYESLMNEERAGPDGKAHKATGKGAVTIEEKTFEYDVEQRTSNEGDG
jgi:hypothetical protein